MALTPAGGRMAGKQTTDFMRVNCFRNQDNVLHKRATHTSERLTFAKTPPKLLQPTMPQHNNVQLASKEARIQLALQATRQNATMTQRHAASIYNIAQKTRSRRLAGTSSRRDCTPNLMNLSITEEEEVVQHILDLDARGFPPWLAAVKDMADSLLAERHRGPVGQNWAANFVKRQPKLKVKFNQKYDYKRALCEDPEVIRGWFRLVEHTKPKYGIQDEDVRSQAEDSRKARFNHDEFDEELSEQEGRLAL
jgi:hypothetical protein